MPDHWTDEDWIGQVGLLAIDPRDEPGSHEVRFERPVEDPVVLASVRSAGEGGPAAPAIRAVGETGFEVRIDPWDEAEPGEGTLSWIALSEGRHELADGRVVEAGSTTLASPGAARFEPGPVAPAPPSPAAATAPPERWSDPATWGGARPGPGDTVRIPAGRTVLLDADATVAGIEVGGTLLVEDARDIALETDWMLLRGGDLRVGSPEDPFEHDFTLTLYGDDPGLDLSLDGLEIVDDTAFLMAMGEDARLEMHGAEAAKAAWTRLAATAPAGAREIRLAEAPGWEAGDRIAVAPTDFDPREAETARIEAVSPDGRTLTLDRPLAHAHFGQLQSFSNGERTWTLDTRAEVGLLSRNIRIEGDAESPEDGLGGHVMAMAGAEMRLSGVELAHMGQAGEPGRYPVHWHMAGDASGQYIRDSAIHHSHNRAVTLHGTQFARVENTVAYDIVGHAYFLEDGSETGNRLEGNLGMLTRAAEAVIPTDHSHVSTFWISNPDNVFLGNVAAGSDHAGFWFLAGDGVTGPSADREAYADIVPRTAPLARFEGNAAHSNPFANLAFDGHADPDTLAFVESEYRPERTPVIRDFTSSKSLDRGIWIRAGAMDLHDVKAADNARATFFSYNQTLHDSLIVGRSANTGTPETPREIAAGRTLPEPYEGRYFRGHSIYDGPSGVIDTHFANFTREDAAIQTQGAAQKSPAHFVSGLSFANVPGRGRVDFSAESGLAHMWSSGLIDLDGSLTGRAGATLTPILETAGGESGFNAPPEAATRPVWGARQTSEAPGLLRADSSAAPGEADTVLWSRSDGEAVRDPGTFHSYHQTSVVLNSDLAYRLQYHELPQEITLSLRFARVGEGVTVELPGIPTEAVVAGAEEVADRAALDGAERTAFTREGTTLVLRLVADAEEADPRFHANTALEEARARRFVAGVTIRTGVEDGRPVVADFEGPEPRATASGQSVRVSEPTPAWADRPDSILFWDAAADGDGRHGRATLALALGGRDWTGFDALHLGAAVQPLGGAQAPGVELLLRDAEQGLTSLGRHDGGAQIDLSAVPGARRDAVDALLFRVDEADLAADPAEAGPGQRLILTDIRLAAGFEARPIRLPGVAAAGETVGIVAEAITAAQPAAGPLEIRGVRDAEGGRARLGAAGDVFLKTEPGFRGVAGVTVLLADAQGRTAEARVSVEVA